MTALDQGLSSLGGRSNDAVGQPRRDPTLVRLRQIVFDLARLEHEIEVVPAFGVDGVFEALRIDDGRRQRIARRDFRSAESFTAAQSP